ncbi:creatininase family protein [Caenispirillum bisanense]|uniref:Creatinine amidohydrolase n=1 Tax=Caenispirillum bisanense TaxID=414052 RepID=A0A286G136_9PROT|nr:creatininase family protein [Caenispirillum bisanense]SOD89251.1 creatinine amidohydrolase [Caenispirillum bisanense]
MNGLQSGYWQDLTTEDFATVDPERVIALLPVAAIEQHGPHLPLYTDACLNEGIVARMLELLPERRTVLVLPTLPVGHSIEHAGFPGTLTLSAETLIALWTEIGASVARTGIRKLILFNSHGGQGQIVDIVASRLRHEHGMLVIRANSYRFGVPDALFPEDELTFGIHGGAVETSMMLHLRADLVRTEFVARFPSVAEDLASDCEVLRSDKPVGFAWAAQDLNPEGAVGDAEDADAERGALIVDHVARRLVDLVADVEAFPLHQLRVGPADA